MNALDRLQAYADSRGLELVMVPFDETKVVGLKDPKRPATFVIDRRSRSSSCLELAQSLERALKRLGAM